MAATQANWLRGKVAFVTGGSRGIGAGIVRRFVEEGARVVFSDLLNEKGKALEEELGKNAAFYRADATSPSDTEALMKFAVERFGRLDCVVNNAGAGGEGGPITETSIEGFDHTISLLLRCERARRLGRKPTGAPPTVSPSSWPSAPEVQRVGELGGKLLDRSSR